MAASPVFNSSERMRRRLGYPESQLGIEVDIVVPGEDKGGGELSLWETHHLRETRPGTAIEISHSLGGDDRDIA